MDDLSAKLFVGPFRRTGEIFVSEIIVRGKLQSIKQQHDEILHKKNGKLR